MIFLRAVIDDVPKNTEKIYGFSPLIKSLFLLTCFDWLTSLFCMCVCVDITSAPAPSTSLPVSNLQLLFQDFVQSLFHATRNIFSIVNFPSKFQLDSVDNFPFKISFQFRLSFVPHHQFHFKIPARFFEYPIR